MNQGTSDSSADVAIVGAGPAGMMAAIAAAQRGARVILCDRLDRPGVKLLATGGGRCNLTNTASPEAFMATFGRQGRFMQPALAAMDCPSLRAFFEALGVPTHCPDAFHVYPSSDSASTVQGALVRRCQELNIDFRPRCGVTALRVQDDCVKGLEAGETCIAAPRVVLAAGGKSWPELGSDGSGFDLAAAAGHKIVEPLPALVPLLARETWPRRCAGVSLPGARVWIDLPGQSRTGVTGDVLFTHTGVSAPAVLDMSAEVSVLLRRRSAVPIRIGLLPKPRQAQPAQPWRPTRVPASQAWGTIIDEWGHSQGRRTVRALLGEHVPGAVAEALCRLPGVPSEARAAHLARPQRDGLAGLLAGVPLTIVGTEGFARSMVTRGGVSLKEVSPHTLESRLVRGLFFAGEVLDLAGPCGGYNLQWAFSSGHLAGLSAGVHKPFGGA